MDKQQTGGAGDLRTIHINDPVKNQGSSFIHNKISTAKYNIISFLPKFLKEQFMKYANVFFLFTAIIQQIPGVSPTSRFTTIIPLSVVIMATAVKEIYEDYVLTTIHLSLKINYYLRYYLILIYQMCVCVCVCAEKTSK
jgi:magnesium-transporting ATPase (P-type)